MAQKEFNEIGEKLSKDLREALDTMDFSKLNDTVSDSVNLALKEAKERIAKTTEQIPNPREFKSDAPNGSMDVFQQIPKTKEELVRVSKVRINGQNVDIKQKQTSAQKSTQKSAQKSTQSSAQTSNRTQSSQKEAKKTSPKVKSVKTRTHGKVTGILSTTFGVMGIVFSVVGLIASASWVALANPGVALGTFIIGFFLVLLIGFSVLMGVGLHYNGKNRRLTIYAKAARGKEYITLEELSNRTGKTVEFLKKDLRKMLERGMLPGSRMDTEGTCLIFTDEAYKNYMEAKKAYEIRQLEAKQQALVKQEEERRLAQKREEEEKSLSASAELRAMIERGNEFLYKIKEANDAIEGEEISKKIDKLELIIRQIFKAVKENPDEIDEMDKFMEYYLPTTVKLLETYERFDKIDSPGENILSAKKEIEKTLDTIERAFLSLLDDLYQDAAFDVETDAAVLKTMLEQEGLVKDSSIKKENDTDFKLFV